MADKDQQSDMDEKSRRALTEKGLEYQQTVFESHVKKVKLAGFMLTDCISKLDTLPKSLKSLEHEESNLNTAFSRYEKIANDYFDFLSRSSLENSQQELENYWPIFQELKSKVCHYVDRIQTAIENCDADSNKSSKTKQSNRSNSSRHSQISTSQLALQKRAKAESEKVKLQFLQKETQLKKEHYEKELEIKVLEQQKSVAAAEVEASVIEKHSQIDNDEFNDKVEPPNETITPFEKTLHFLNELSDPQPETKLSAKAPVFVPTSTPCVKNQASNVETLSDSMVHYKTDNAANRAKTMCDHNDNILEPSNYSAKKNLLLESFQKQLFDDKPDHYIVWKTQFQVMTSDIKCSPLEEITLLTSCINRNADAYRLVMSARSACASDPERCLQLIWERMDERFGSPELIESTLKTRLLNLPDSLDNKKLYDLSDLLNEILAVKNLSAYSAIFAYLDSSLGLKPIIQKLPRFIQDKWVARVVSYKKQHAVLFPPFSEFVNFIGEISSIRNDPGLNFSSPKEGMNSRTKFSTSTLKRQVASHKTDITAQKQNAKLICLIHPNSKHSVNQCNAFRTKSIQERKEILKPKNVCLRCCETTTHFAKKCTAKLQCNICNSERHCTALHIHEQNSSGDISGMQDNGEEKSLNVTVKAKCTEICGQFSGKSCARIVPVRVYRKGQEDNSISCFAMLDDQSNKTLGKGELFDRLDIHSKRIQYTMQSCSGTTVTHGRVADELIVKASDDYEMNLPTVLECDNLPENVTEIPTSNVAKHFAHMKDIAKYLPDSEADMNILLLIGRDLPMAHHVIDQRIGSPELPFAQRSPLGWTIIGDVCLSGQHATSAKVYKTFISKSGSLSTLEPCQQVVKISDGISVTSPSRTKVTQLNIFETSSEDNKPGLSMDDRLFLEIMDREFHIGSDGKWTAPLPFRSTKEPIPDNFSMALNRARSLDYSLRNNAKKKEHFMTFMQKILDHNHAELAPEIPPSKDRWYLPLFGVYHPRKLDQIRGVFDSSARYQGISLNSQLLQGPDLINSLLGILIGFRKEMIGVVADIEQMFHSFLVQEEHRDYLRFLWHKDNIFENLLVPYRMRAHVFGNSPSPSIAMYGLRRIGDLSKETHGSEISDFIINHFYVDDGLISCSTSEKAISLITETQDAMKVHGQLRLHKFASNSKIVMDSFKSEDIAKGLVNLDFEKDTLTQRSLGLLWDLNSDTFTFSISTNEKPATRRGILSVVNSLFDPLGFIAPITICGKIILRKIVSLTVDWDEPLSDNELQEWYRWRENLPYLESLKIPRVMVPYLSDTITRELLTFCDASELAISAVSFLRVTYPDNTTKIGFVLGKSKVAPRSGHTIPRLELCAAVLAIEVSQIAIEYLQTDLRHVKFYSDSRVVLGYINNNQRRFFVYVANRVAYIRKFSEPSQWFYVRSEENPADVGTRGINPIDIQQSSWLNGPISLNSCQDTHHLISPDNDTEIRSNKVDISTNAEQTSRGFDDNMYSRFSDWDRLVKALVTIRKCILVRQNKLESNDIDLIKSTEAMLIRDIQGKFFRSEIDCLKSSNPINRKSSIYQLDPFLDDNGILCVGGRLRKSHLEYGLKHPIILPAKHYASTLIVLKYHSEVKHQGRHMTEGRIRSEGFWIVGCKRLVSSILFKCVTCRKLRSKPSVQKMSDLPADRLSFGEPPFTYIGVDMFGPFEVVTRRTRGGSANSKRWGAIFTCLSTRAVHIEVVEEMTTSSFINALRRFTAIRGSVKVIRSDKGTNFVGTVNELKLDSVNVGDVTMRNFLNKQGTTWIFNPPHSSHMGGVWERMIATTRRIFESMLLEYGSHRLSHEVLSTFFAEASAIINSRPLIPVSTDPENPIILSPCLLLTQKSPVLPSVVDDMGKSVDIDYDMKIDRVALLRKQWEKVKHLTAFFWKRWKVEYVNTLQRRQKWESSSRNVKVGDVVMVRDKELCRSAWPMGIVEKALPSDDGLVRKIVVRVIVNGEAKTYSRPIHEVIVLVPE